MFGLLFMYCGVSLDPRKSIFRFFKSLLFQFETVFHLDKVLLQLTQNNVSLCLMDLT